MKTYNIGITKQNGGGKMEVLARRLVELRGNLTQTELAEKSGVPQSAISEIEAGKRVPRVDTLQKIAKALGVPVSKFFEDDDIPKASNE